MQLNNIQKFQPLSFEGRVSSFNNKNEIMRNRGWACRRSSLGNCCNHRTYVCQISTCHRTYATPSPETAMDDVSSESSVQSGDTPPPTTLDFETFVQNFASKVSGSLVFEDHTSPQYKAADFVANGATYTSTIADDAVIGDFLCSLNILLFDGWRLLVRVLAGI
jgi:hypothetical protein